MSALPAVPPTSIAERTRTAGRASPDDPELTDENGRRVGAVEVGRPGRGHGPPGPALRPRHGRPGRRSPSLCRRGRSRVDGRAVETRRTGQAIAAAATGPTM